jgi:SepF-like predicted cell division protein (DUF552 family)
VNDADEAIYQAIKEAERIRSATRKKSLPQVRGSERDVIRATALTWFQSHRPKLVERVSPADLRPVDELYQKIIEASHRSAARSSYVNTLKDVSDILVQIRSGNVVNLAAASTTDAPPDFSKLISDAAMQVILEKRWTECVICISSGAPLAAVVMIGGLLEGLLLAKVNRETNKTPIFTAAAAPRDKQNKTLLLKDWTLQDYIAVGHELKWITVAAKDVGVVLRDYRNYIHPQKELSHGVSLTTPDAVILWEISKSISRQLLK